MAGGVQSSARPSTPWPCRRGTCWRRVPGAGASLQGCLSCADKSELSSLVLPFLYSDVIFRDFLVGQWLRLCTSTAEGLGLIAGQGSKIPYATQKT